MSKNNDVPQRIVHKANKEFEYKLKNLNLKFNLFVDDKDSMESFIKILNVAKSDVQRELDNLAKING